LAECHPGCWCGRPGVLGVASGGRVGQRWWPMVGMSPGALGHGAAVVGTCHGFMGAQWAGSLGDCGIEGEESWRRGC
jgi:hypothetical protein